MEAAKNTVSNLLGYGSNEVNKEEGSHHVTGGETKTATETNTPPPTTLNTAADQESSPTKSTVPDPSQDASNSHPSLKKTLSSNSSGSSSGADLKPVQSPKQGPDPALVGDAQANEGNTKMSGTGVDGSHSAVFGLTPDGHKHGDTTHGVTKVEPAHSDETTVAKKEGN